MNEAPFGFVRRKRGLLANNAGVPNIAFDDGTIGFGNFADQPGGVRAEDLPLGRHGVDDASGNHGVKFGGEVRHIRDDSDFAVRRPAVQFYSIHDFAQDEVPRDHDPRHRPATGLIEPNVRQLPLLGERRLPAGRLEDPART